MRKSIPDNPSLFEEIDFNEFDSIKDICSKLKCEYGTPGWPDKFGEAIFNYLKVNNIPSIRTLSLFSGAGGLDIGFHDLGFDIIESVEIEKKFCNTLIQNSGEGKKFSSSKPNCIDIRDYKGDNLGTIDFIIGGPPCQTFSAAGRRQGGVLGTTDARGILFLEYVRLLKKLQPKGFLFENVYGIVGAQNGEPWKAIIDSFTEVGYKLFYRILDAADYGVPQHRERLIIVGLKNGTFEFPRPINGCDSRNNVPYYSAGCAIKGLKLTEEEKITGISGRFGSLIDEIPPGLNYSYFTKELGHPTPIFAWRSKFSDFMYKADPEMPVRTIKAQGGQYTGPLHWDSRYFSTSEFKRLQTFPDDYEISGVKQVAVHQIGNSVPPQLARMLALAIRIQVFNTSFPFNLELISDNVVLSFRKNKRLLTDYYRNKAKKAIESLSNKKRKAPKDSSFYLTLTSKFKYIKSDEEGDYRVNVHWVSNELYIDLYPNNENPTEVSNITIIPQSKWSIQLEKVTMKVYSKDWFAVTAAWKVLDRLLIENNMKADLVQLNGYFQYGSQMNCSLESRILDRINIMQPIIEGKVVGSIINSFELAKSWNVQEIEILNIAKWLRTLGYEIRNSHTNPQLSEGVWLIPYKFPTLLPESVQLNKKLD